MIRIRPRHTYAARKLAQRAEDQFHERKLRERLDFLRGMAIASLNVWGR